MDTLTLPIDPIEAVTAALIADGDLAALVGGRVAVQHRYATPDTARGRAGWPDTARGLTLAAGGVEGAGLADHDDEMQRRRVVATAYGATPAEAGQVWAALRLACRRYADRQVAALPDGRRALIYYISPQDGPVAGVDTDIRMHTLSGALTVAVAASPV